MVETLNDPPFTWTKKLSRGIHTIETIAYDDNEVISKDMIDILVLA